MEALTTKLFEHERRLTELESATNNNLVELVTRLKKLEKIIEDSQAQERNDAEQESRKTMAELRKELAEAKAKLGQK